MKKILLIIGASVLGIAVIIIAVGIYRFNFTSDDMYFSTGEKIDSKNINSNKPSEDIKDNNIPVEITNQVWQWVETKMNNDEIITPKKSEAFSLNLKGDGSLSGTTDCNGFFGSYTISDNKLLFDRMGSTLMFCENSQESVFLKSLGEVESYLINQDNILVLQLKIDSGAMFFKLQSPVISTSTTAPIITDATTTTTNVTITTPAVGLANPASTNCSKLGGSLAIEKRTDGGEYGLCYFEDNRACEEWALMRGECPTGGVKTTGFDTIDQKYCAWSGGETFAVANSVCTFKNGKKCSTVEFYNGNCSSAQF